MTTAPIYSSRYNNLVNIQTKPEYKTARQLIAKSSKIVRLCAYYERQAGSQKPPILLLNDVEKQTKRKSTI